MGAGAVSSGSPGVSAMFSRFRAGMVAASSCGVLAREYWTTSPAEAGAADLKADALETDAGGANAVAPSLETGVDGFHSVRSLSTLPSRPELFHNRLSKGKWRNRFGRSVEASAGDAVSTANNSVRLELADDGAAAGDASASALGRRHQASRASGRSSGPKALTASGEAQPSFCWMLAHPESPTSNITTIPVSRGRLMAVPPTRSSTITRIRETRASLDPPRRSFHRQANHRQPTHSTACPAASSTGLTCSKNTP
jgi:hypothetical protein